MADYYFLILGLFLGSFIHTLSFRVSENISVFRRSHCEKCQHPISIVGLIPIIGYIVQKGTCRHCRCKIPAAYPLIELLNGVIVWVIYKKTGVEVRLLFELVIWESLFLIALFDLKTMLILSTPVMICFVARATMIGYLEPNTLMNSLIGMAAGAGVFHFISYFYTVIRRKVGLGEGDTTLIGLLGFILTWHAVIPVIFISSVVGIVMVAGMTLINKMSLKDAFPFGPALIFGAFAYRFFPEFFQQMSLSRFYPIFL